MSARPPTPPAAHAVAVYDSDDDLRSRVVPYLRAGLDSGDRVVAVVTQRAQRALRAGLAGDGDVVQWHAPGLAYHQLGGLLEGIRAFLAERAGVPTRLLMENDTDGDQHRHAAHLRIEAAANELFPTYGTPCTCLYDRRRYPDHVLDAVATVHPQLVEPDGRPRRNDDYIEPNAYLAAHPGPLSSVPPQVALDVQITALADLRALRQELCRTGQALGLPAQASEALQLAANEVATNALRHGATPGRVRIWHRGRSVVARIDDAGTTGHRAVTAGYLRPEPTARGGLGLWLVRQLADVVHIEVGARGTSVELHFPHP